MCSKAGVLGGGDIAICETRLQEAMQLWTVVADDQLAGDLGRAAGDSIGDLHPIHLERRQRLEHAKRNVDRQDKVAGDARQAVASCSKSDRVNTPEP